MCFRQTIKGLMHAHGDRSEPREDTVEMLEGFLKVYMKDLAHDASDVARIKGTLDEECFSFALRKDLAKFKRVKNLMKSMDSVEKSTRFHL